MKNIDENSDVGYYIYVFDVDISHLDHLYDDCYCDLSFLPVRKFLPNSKIPKLMGALHEKKNYMVHDLTLK